QQQIALPQLFDNLGFHTAPLSIAAPNTACPGDSFIEPDQSPNCHISSRRYAGSVAALLAALATLGLAPQRFALAQVILGGAHAGAQRRVRIEALLGCDID